MGCGETLELNNYGTIVCAHVRCRSRFAAHTILSNPETDHIVTFTKDGFSIKHPLRERIEDALLDCKFHEHCMFLQDEGCAPEGTLRAKDNGDSWTWEVIR